MNQFYNFLPFSYFIGGLAVITIILSFKQAGTLYKTVGSLFLLIGLYIWWFHTSLDVEILLNFDKLIGLISLFFLLPVLNAIVKVGRYDQILSSIITKNVNSVDKLYQKTTITSYILTIFLNMAVIPLLLGAVKKRIDHLGDKFKTTFFTHSILRPYALVMLWSPTEVLLAVTIDFTNERYLTLLPILLLISFSFFLIDWFIHKIRYRQYVLPAIDERYGSSHPLFKRKLTEFIIAVLLFICIILSINQVLTQGFLFTIVVVIVPFAFIWALFVRKPKRFLKLGSLLIKNNEKSYYGIFFLFLSASLFVEMIPYTTIFDSVNVLLTKIYESYSLFFFYLIIGLFFLVLAIIGFHPMVSLTILIPFLQGFLDDVSLGIAITVIGASITTGMYGPFNVTPTLLAVLLRKSPYQITLKNILFAFCFILANVLIAFLVTTK